MNLLLLGTSKDIGSRTVQLLQQAGHEVQFPQTREEAIANIRERIFDCVVLSYSLSNDIIKELTELLRQHCPTCPRVAISENGYEDWELAPSRTVHLHQGGEALLLALAGLERRVCTTESPNAAGEHLGRTKCKRHSDSAPVRLRPRS